MYLKKLKIWNFRKYGVKGSNNDLPGIEVEFNPNFNLLIGENDAGKTAIIDAIKLVVGTTSEDSLRIVEDDFHVKDGQGAKDIKIECIFSGISDAESGVFFEWLTFDSDNNYELQVRLIATKQSAVAGMSERIEKIIKAGPEISSIRLEGAARELLRTTYLKPLRNAEVELKPGIRSRLAQILKSHPSFITKDPSVKHKLEVIFKTANDEVEDFFKDQSAGGGGKIDFQLKQYLAEFFNKSLDDSTPMSKFEMSPVKLNEILRRLSLMLESVPSGLGSLNLLFIAAELLLHDEELTIGPNLTMIEEIEAHLHPQAQLRLIKYLQKKVEEEGLGGQFILTTHSPTLAASAQLKHVILLHDATAYPMGPAYTQLSVEDYEFLERFLDATKTNLFFAKGVIFVEGDAENLLLPIIAELIGRPLHKFGVSIVNIGNTAFKRYVKIYSRSEEWIENYPESTFNMPVSVITDLDVRPMEYYEDKKKTSEETPKLPEIYLIAAHNLAQIAEKMEIDQEQINHLSNKAYCTQGSLKEELSAYTDSGSSLKASIFSEIVLLTKVTLSKETIESLKNFRASYLTSEFSDFQGNIELYYAKNWTLEYEIALSEIKWYLLKAIQDVQFSSLSQTQRESKFSSQYDKLQPLEVEQQAYQIYRPLLKKNVSKAAAAQYLARILLEHRDDIKEKIQKDDHLKYLRDAIYHATGGAELDGTDANS